MHTTRIFSGIASSVFATLVFAATLAHGAQAEPYPVKPIRIIVPYSTGSGVDTYSRLISTELARVLKQPVIVENKEGAGGVIGSQIVAQAPADGYTFLMGGMTWAVAPALTKNAGYDSFKDFVPVARVGFIQSMLLVSPTSPINSIADMVAEAKAHPNKLTYSSSGLGSPSNLAMEYFKAMAKIEILHVPYKSTSQALTDVMSGQVSMNLPILTAAIPMIADGRLKGVAVTGPRRARQAPNVPTMAESGLLPDYDASNWAGLVARAGTPQEIVLQVNQAVNQVLAQPEMKEKFEKLGVELSPTTPEIFTREAIQNTDKWVTLIKKLNMNFDQ